MSAIFNFFFIVIVFQHFLIRNIEAELYVWYECWTKKLSLSFRNEYSWFVRQRCLSKSLILSSHSLFDASYSDNQEQRKSDYTAQYMQMWKENYVSNIIPSICVKFTLSYEKSFFFVLFTVPFNFSLAASIIRLMRLSLSNEIETQLTQWICWN